MGKSEKDVGGRPTKYKKEYCEMLIEHMKQGYSFDSFGALLPDGGASKETLYAWTRAHRRFLDAKKQGEMQARLWWEKIATAGMAGKIKGFNATVWVFSMKNRFGWKDRLQTVDEDEDGFEFVD